MKRRKPSYLPENPASEVFGPSSAVVVRMRETRTSKLLMFLALAAMALVTAAPSYGQGTTFNCSSGFASSAATGVCPVSASGPSSGQQHFYLVFGGPGTVSGSNVLLLPQGETHSPEALNWQQAVNVQAFTATFTFVPNGQNVAFVLQNNTNTAAGGAGPGFSSGAGCEAGFYQISDSGNTPPNNIFALELDSYEPLTANGPFTYSSVQIYQTGQTPCTISGAPDWTFTPKYSTSPVPLNSPASAQGTSTGHTYSATIKYDGSTVTFNMYDVTAGGSCPGSSCFTYTWSNVNIPSIVGSNTAYVGFTTASGLSSQYPLFIDTASYTVGSAGPKPGTPLTLQGNMVAQ